MTDTTAMSTAGASFPAGTPFVAAQEAGDPFQHERVTQLLAGLRETTSVQRPVVSVDLKYENHLAWVRLGMATSLFYALRAKHAPTASHSLRVALACSAWAQRLGLDDEQRDRFEVAALLHDIGKIGIPDSVLRKPGKLSVDEQLIMDTCSATGCEILQGCIADEELLDIVRYSGVWFNSRRFGDGLGGQALPLGARVVLIVDAFDSMTSDHVYRRAMSRERAIKELLSGGGTQFDPELVRDYSRLLEERPEMLQTAVVNRWLQQLRPDGATGFWATDACAIRTDLSFAPASAANDTNFYQQLLSQMNDGVAFTDSQATIIRWNAALEQMTQIACDAVIGKSWNCASLSFVGEQGEPEDDDCPVQACLQTHTPQSRMMMIDSASGDPVPVLVRVAPVVGSVPGAFGTVVVIRDLSDQASLQRRLDTLHEQVTRDPLTGVANRTEFDRRIAELSALAAAGGPMFSLIICDIDHFKQVNDIHGHPAGDEALVNFAAVLSGFSRDGDLVARYGGEEFVFLATNCDNATATKRAESIRKTLEHTRLPSLGNDSVTASFGVTQFQAGDSAATLLARADRALLRAKDNGRNRVVQMGCGTDDQEKPTSHRGWLSWFDSSERRPDRELEMTTPVPVDLAIEKLKGFIADHDAEILGVTENQVSLRVTAVCTTGGRRRVDHQIALSVVLMLDEVQPAPGDTRWTMSSTRVRIHMKPIRNRDRRRRELRPCTDTVIASLKSYLMGQIVEDDGAE